MLLGGFRLVTPWAVASEAWMAVHGGRVAATGSGGAPGTPDVDLGGLTVVPGFVDLHCHGGGGASFATVDEGEVERAVAFQRRRGTTTTVASLVSSGAGPLRHQLGVLAGCTRAGLIAGSHLEGPYLSVARCGAHAPQVLRDPDPDELAGLHRAAAGTLRMVTVAPERAGALAAISWLAARGVLPAIGHTDASYEETLAGIDAGARVATHLGNAMGPLHHRRPGPMSALLAAPSVTCELIGDGVHLHDGFAALVARTVGSRRVALVSDAVAAAGLPDGELRLGPTAVTVRNGEARVSGSGALAGSTATLDTAFARAVHRYGLSLPEAVRATSTNAARLLGLDAMGTGDLRAGSPADLVVLDEQLCRRRVMAAGAWVG